MARSDFHLWAMHVVAVLLALAFPFTAHSQTSGSATDISREFQTRAFQHLERNGLRLDDAGRAVLAQVIGRGLAALISQGATPERLRAAEADLDRWLAQIVARQRQGTGSTGAGNTSQQAATTGSVMGSTGGTAAGSATGGVAGGSVTEQTDAVARSAPQFFQCPPPHFHPLC
jgi:hypothetical protein